MNSKKSIRDLVDLAYSLDAELATNLSASIARLAWVLSSAQLSSGKKEKVLMQLNTYLDKKADEFDPILIEANAANLRKIRNDLAHGKQRRNQDFSPLYPSLWKAIIKLGARLGPAEIENLLAYSLRVENMNISSRGASPAKVVAVYRPLFNLLEPEPKREIFTDLLLRLFSDSESMMLLNVESKR